MNRHTDQVEAEAADFLVRRMGTDWSDIDEDEFAKWMARSMAHKAAFWRLEFGAEKVDRLIGEHQSALWNDNQSEGAGTNATWWKIAASIVLAFCALGGYFAYDTLRPNTRDRSVEYATNFGGISTAVLPDRTRLTLNSETTLRFEESSSQRNLWLKSGEAFFEVAHDESRPFVVHSGDRTITVVGTKFSVERQAARTVVSVLEGKVRVSETEGTILGGGQTAILNPTSTLVTTSDVAALERKLSWRSGMLSFSDTPIREAAAQFNRYNERKIVVTDDEVGAVRIGGSFNLANEDQFVYVLQSAYGFKVVSDENRIALSSR